MEETLIENYPRDCPSYNQWLNQMTQNLSKHQSFPAQQERKLEYRGVTTEDA